MLMVSHCNRYWGQTEYWLVITKTFEREGMQSVKCRVDSCFNFWTVSFQYSDVGQSFSSLYIFQYLQNHKYFITYASSEQIMPDVMHYNEI